MKELIQNKLRQIERENNVTVLFCVESGSRAWEIESSNSDYDVRFVYKRPLKDYLLLNPLQDVIKRTYDKNGDSCPEEGCFIDILGFDVFKFGRLLQSSNPQAIEWLLSPIIYEGTIPPSFVSWMNEWFNPISLYYHYKSMCRQNYLKYIKSGSLVSYKKYLYAMRGLLNAEYVAIYGLIPPISFVRTLKIKSFGVLFPLNIHNKLLEIVRLKRLSLEKEIVPNLPEIDSFIEGFLKDDSDAPLSRRSPMNHLLDEAIQKKLL